MVEREQGQGQGQWWKERCCDCMGSAVGDVMASFGAGEALWPHLANHLPTRDRHSLVSAALVHGVGQLSVEEKVLADGNTARCGVLTVYVDSLKYCRDR